MSQDRLIKMKCEETGHIRFSTKNKKGHPDKISRKMFNPEIRKHTKYTETKK